MRPGKRGWMEAMTEGSLLRSKCGIRLGRQMLLMVVEVLPPIHRRLRIDAALNRLIFSLSLLLPSFSPRWIPQALILHSGIDRSP